MTWKGAVNPKNEAVADAAPIGSAEVVSEEPPEGADAASKEPLKSDERKDPKLTKEDVLGSGWLSLFQLIAALVTMIVVAGRIGWDWRALGVSSTGVCFAT